MDLVLAGSVSGAFSILEKLMLAEKPGSISKSPIEKMIMAKRFTPRYFLLRLESWRNCFLPGNMIL